MGKAGGPDKTTGKELQMLSDVFVDNCLNIAKKLRALMIACFHHNGRQHRFSVSIQREVLKTLEITVPFHF